MAAPPEPCRRLPLRFTLRLALVAITLLCIGLAVWTQRAREQRRIVQHIDVAYGSVDYDYEQIPTPKLPTARSPVPQWLLDRLGVDFFHSVVRAHVRGKVDMEQVSRLTSLRELTIWKHDLTDEQFAHVARLRNLQVLIVQSDMHASLPGDYPDTTQIGDASLAVVADLPNLQRVYLDGTRFGPEGLARLAESASLRDVCVNCCDERVRPEHAEPFRGRANKLKLRTWTEGIGQKTLAEW
jgi:hypothetical protein